ncbi:hypothetical protein LOC67_20795 [Stieleria sp. JC731]|uniref:hypothetical protein n=1 Tax=Pirellulaceae TaxID=2691357 RepID=UPI001E4AF5C3|nr:hypothetical protein [Stieleria sp. JC731]MCC9602993.1 hypothetical protein [Stieleria sp. JC731]
MLELILLLTVALPIAWLYSEYHGERNVRIGFGVASLMMSFGVAWCVGKLDRLQSNIYFSEATKDLIQNTIVELEAGKANEVLEGLKSLRKEFRPTYETRDDYDLLVDTYIHKISEDPIEHQNGTPFWSHETLESYSSEINSSQAPDQPKTSRDSEHDRDEEESSLEP